MRGGLGGKIKIQCPLPSNRFGVRIDSWAAVQNGFVSVDVVSSCCLVIFLELIRR